ncbi:MAG TPA: Coenzyme F420 hydrogenase/dehydrogenase, beta subunit C-terminal domain [Pseudonocardiaceae bacterium]|nr:Coenzyme F420 hydrogenase/dehydrogenase, beta subunit C-terminal domain [Pseudonocardiaceae bacterium]
MRDGATHQDCGGCDLCTEVCPGRHPGAQVSEARIFGRTRTDDERWTGIRTATYYGQARDSVVLDAASAGGATTTLLITALRTGAIDAALVVGRDEHRPWVPAPRLVERVDELIDCAQANYSITPNLQLLRDTRYERVGVVGLACQMQAIGKMRNLPEVPEVAAKVALTIEIACASNTRLQGTEDLIQNRLRLPLVAVDKMKYRAGEYPGEFTVWDREDQRHSAPFHELVTQFKRFKTFRCQSCPDWWSGLSDISIADGDPNIFRVSRNNEKVTKGSLILTRTPTGESLVHLSAERGELLVRPTEFGEEQSLGLQRKRNRYLKYRDRYPGRTPDGPMSDEERVVPLSDDEVIESMSRPEAMS